MRKLCVLTLALAVMSFQLEARERKVRTQTTLPWHTDVDAAFAESAKTGKPVLMVFR